MNRSKELLDLIIIIFFGYLGIHKFKEKKIGIGLLYLFTCGLFGIGWIIDVVKAVLKLFSANKEKTVVSASEKPSTDKTEQQHKPAENIAQSAPNEKKTNKTIYMPPVFYDDVIMQYHYHYVNLRVPSDIPDNIEVGDFIDLESFQEDQNETEEVMAVTKNGIPIGYIENETIKRMCIRWIDSDTFRFASRITEIDNENNRICIYLSFFKPSTDVTIEQTFQMKISEKKYLDSYVSEGDIVDVDYDPFSDKFKIEELGYAPKSTNKVFECLYLDSEYITFVRNIEELEDEKYLITLYTIRCLIRMEHFNKNSNME